MGHAAGRRDSSLAFPELLVENFESLVPGECSNHPLLWEIEKTPKVEESDLLDILGELTIIWSLVRQQRSGGDIANRYDARRRRVLKREARRIRDVVDIDP